MVERKKKVSKKKTRAKKTTEPKEETISDYVASLPKDTHEQEKERLTKAKADKVELEVKQKEGHLIPVADVRVELIRVVQAMQAKMLSLPSALAGELAENDSPPEIEDILNAHIREALTELSRVRV